MSLFIELKRRNVLRVAAAYVLASWLLIQVAETIFPLFGFDDAPARIAVIVLAIGFIPALIFAWAFELTPEGLKKESEVDRTQSITPYTGKKLDRMIMVVLALALGFFAFDKFVLDPQREAKLQAQKAVEVEEARQQGRSDALVESYGDQSIAVLAFDDMSPEGDQEYLSDGIAEELLNLLARIPKLRVISRSSAFSFKGKDVPIPEIAEQLNVAHILEGSVRKAGNRVRITAQLIEARSDTHLWSESYDRDLDDIFAIQDEIAAAMVEQLKLKLLNPVPPQPETDAETYALYLRALHLLPMYTAEAWREALELLQKAVVFDPSYANSWALLSRIYIGSSRVQLIPVEVGAPLALKAVGTALELDPANGWAHLVRVIHAVNIDRDLAKAANYVQAAFSSGRADVETLVIAAELASWLGDMNQAIRIMQYAIARDPKVATYHGLLSRFYWYAGRLEESKLSVQVALNINPNMFLLHGRLAAISIFQGDFESSLLEVEKELWPEFRQLLKVIYYHEMGEHQKSAEELRILTEQATPEVPWVFYANAYVGNHEAALQWIEQNADVVRFDFLASINNDVRIRAILKEPRYLKILRSLGIAPEQLAEIELNLELPE